MLHKLIHCRLRRSLLPGLCSTTLLLREAWSPLCLRPPRMRIRIRIRTRQRARKAKTRLTSDLAAMQCEMCSVFKYKPTYVVILEASSRGTGSSLRLLPWQDLGCFKGGKDSSCHDSGPEAPGEVAQLVKLFLNTYSPMLDIQHIPLSHRNQGDALVNHCHELEASFHQLAAYDRQAR